MLRKSLAAAVVICASPALAQSDDCIENIAGQMVCGSDADAVRARIRAEAAAARGEDPRKSRGRSRSGSVYDTFGQAAFVRGGYVFSADANHGEEVNGDGFGVYAGYRAPISKRGFDALSLEVELGHQRTPHDKYLFSIDAYSSMMSLRWDHAFSPQFGYFASAGVGVAYLRAYANDAVLGPFFWEDEFTFGYTGRSGFRANISETFSLEAAYRYAGALGVDFGGPYSLRLGSHSAELGLDVRF